MTRNNDPISQWTHLKLVERHLLPDTWSITAPSDRMSVFAPSTGSILYRGDQQITAGRLTNLHRWRTTNEKGVSTDTTTASFTSDLLLVGSRIVIPTPSYAMPSGAVFNFPDEYDLRSGPIETIMLNYIRYHVGELATTSRKILGLRVPASLGRGGNTQVSARFDYLGVLLQSLGEAGNLRLRTKHTEDIGGTWIDVVIDESADLSDDVRFGTADSAAAGIITDWDYEIGAPTSTRAIVGAGGEMTARDMLWATEPGAEIEWGMAVETFVDQRHVDPTSPDKLSELTRAAQEELDERAGPIKVSFTPTLGPDLEYRRDVRIGDIVGYDLPGLDPAKDKIREVTTEVTVTRGKPTETVSVVVGTPDAPTSRSQQQVARALRGINGIQRST